MMFSAYKSVIVSPCASDLFASKVTKITRYMDVRFWWSFFSAFSVCDDCILKSTRAWLLKLSVLYIHSFIQVNNTTFQIKTVFNNVLFSTEVHNPLHAHLLALSHIYILSTHRKSSHYYTMNSHILKRLPTTRGGRLTVTADLQDSSVSTSPGFCLPCC